MGTQIRSEAKSRAGSKSRAESKSRNGAHTDISNKQKIPIILEMLKYNSSIKFPDRQTLEDLIDYVNSDMTNKFTLVINKTISRPDTSFNKGQMTPSRIQSGVRNLPPIDRKTSRSLSQSNAIGFGDDNDILMTSMNDDVFKVE